MCLFLLICCSFSQLLTNVYKPVEVIPSIQVRRVEVFPILGDLSPVPQVVTLPAGQPTLATPVVDSARVGTEEGVETTVGRGVTGVAVSKVPFAYRLILVIFSVNTFSVQTNLQYCCLYKYL